MDALSPGGTLALPSFQNRGRPLKVVSPPPGTFAQSSGFGGLRSWDSRAVVHFASVPHQSQAADVVGATLQGHPRKAGIPAGSTEVERPMPRLTGMYGAAVQEAVTDNSRSTSTLKEAATFHVTNSRFWEAALLPMAVIMVVALASCTDLWVGRFVSFSTWYLSNLYALTHSVQVLHPHLVPLNAPFGTPFTSNFSLWLWSTGTALAELLLCQHLGPMSRWPRAIATTLYGACVGIWVLWMLDPTFFSVFSQGKKGFLNSIFCAFSGFGGRRGRSRKWRAGSWFTFQHRTEGGRQDGSPKRLTSKGYKESAGLDGAGSSTWIGHISLGIGLVTLVLPWHQFLLEFGGHFPAVPTSRMSEIAGQVVHSTAMPSFASSGRGLGVKLPSGADANFDPSFPHSPATFPPSSPFLSALKGHKYTMIEGITSRQPGAPTTFGGSSSSSFSSFQTFSFQESSRGSNIDVAASLLQSSQIPRPTATAQPQAQLPFNTRTAIFESILDRSGRGLSSIDSDEEGPVDEEDESNEDPVSEGEDQEQESAGTNRRRPWSTDPELASPTLSKTGATYTTTAAIDGPPSLPSLNVWNSASPGAQETMVGSGGGKSAFDSGRRNSPDHESAGSSSSGSASNEESDPAADSNNYNEVGRTSESPSPSPTPEIVPEASSEAETEAPAPAAGGDNAFAAPAAEAAAAEPSTEQESETVVPAQSPEDIAAAAAAAAAKHFSGQDNKGKKKPYLVQVIRSYKSSQLQRNRRHGPEYFPTTTTLRTALSGRSRPGGGASSVQSSLSSGKQNEGLPWDALLLGGSFISILVVLADRRKSFEFSMPYLLFYNLVCLRVPDLLGHTVIETLGNLHSHASPAVVTTGISFTYMISMQVYTMLLGAVCSRMSSASMFPRFYFVVQIYYYLFWYMMLMVMTPGGIEDKSFWLMVGLLNGNCLLSNIGIFTQLYSAVRYRTTFSEPPLKTLFDAKLAAQDQLADVVSLLIVPATATSFHICNALSANRFDSGAVFTLWQRFGALLIARLATGVLTEEIFRRRLDVLHRADNLELQLLPLDGSRNRSRYLNDICVGPKLALESIKNIERCELYFCAVAVSCAYSVFQHDDAPVRYAFVGFGT